MSRNAERDLREKLRLESQFTSNLGRILRNPVEFQRRNLEQFLVGHYNRTYDSFSRNYQDRKEIRMPKFQRLTMKDYVQHEFENRANRQASLISENSKKIWNKIQQMDLPNQEKLNMFQFRMGVRSVTISATETEWASEHTKLREVQFLQGGISNSSGTKRWDVIGDNRMRDHHAFAKGQTVNLDEPFTVDNEYLLYPGDPSLGASAGNIVNCRCSVFYSVDSTELTRISQL